MLMKRDTLPAGIVMLGGSVAAGVLWVALLSQVFPAGSQDVAANLLLGGNTAWFQRPFTIQNLMWIVFFIGGGELFVRYLTGCAERDQLKRGLLPEDERTVLRQRDIGPIYRRIRHSDPDGRYWLQRLLTRALLQFQSSGSVDQVCAVFNSSVELCQHEGELRYNLLRYIVWLTPTLGFVGTVFGIASALNEAGVAFATMAADLDIARFGPEMMQSLVAELGVAFYTTLLALLQSALLMFAMHRVQGLEEGSLNLAGQYCLENLINRLYEQQPSDRPTHS